MPEREKRVKRWTLAQLIADYVKRIPNACGWSLVKRKGRMEVQVQVKTERKGEQ